MSEHSPMLVFKSSRFAIEPGEDNSTNPRLYGKALATWLGKELVSGFGAENLVAEDFGWLVNVPHPKHALYIACVSTDETAKEWRVFVFAEGGLMARMLRKVHLRDAVDELYARLKALVTTTSGFDDVQEE